MMNDGEAPMSMQAKFGRAADWIATATGNPGTFILACVVVIVWAATGPVFAYSDTWQLVINTGTTIVTFLMVFLIQNTQNRDGAALQAKVDELIRSSAAQNAFIGIEHLSQEEVEVFRQACESARAKALQMIGDRAVGRANEKASKASQAAQDLLQQD
jgi:low affinity Fe/Cu permease